MTLDWILTGKIIWCICLALWAVLRWIPNRRSRKVKIDKTSRTPSERFSMAVSTLGLGIIPAIWVFTGIPGNFDHVTSPIIVIIGLMVFAGSLRLFRITHKALGAMWSHSLDLREGHKLVTSGIYENVRHPMYSAFWLWAVAQPFLLSNWVAGFSGIAGFGTLYFLRVGQEERMMEERFGEEYRQYCSRTKRIIPGIH
ncbi:MAG: protein-S-isoprenylcysteine O-methyltransferase [Rhizobiaceae bacterium]